MANLKSLSARRAWIEIGSVPRLQRGHGVALRKESVDRNSFSTSSTVPVSSSLSARRAWIEIFRGGLPGVPAQVALRKESVDRNDQRKATATESQ